VRMAVLYELLAGGPGPPRDAAAKSRPTSQPQPA